ncbi:homoserine dehydrogenase [Aneurinibacillus danicus]|uniref:Homoserine dehydrogenase n=3 Tax=Aneurinibacillus TaxID=55079 RepID=A0A511VA39_9BACL|nr:homoserine dehydrogenase [Aneurinibacillus danicus]GEN35776.1 homoserine dehydrogenase [Aneurinibacillus danicus]
MMKTWKIALLGLGTVGSGVMAILHTHAERIRKQTGARFEVVGILVRDLQKPRKIEVNQSLLTTEIEAIWHREPDIVIDAMGGLDPTLGFIEEAIRRKCHVVSANKEMLAAYGRHLHQLAEEQNVSLLYEASVGGGIPILNTLSQQLNANRVTRVFGILNGTTNYILTKMEEEGLSYEEALRQAQDLGFAEADPTADVEGYDAFNKIQIIAHLCFGGHMQALTSERTGITSVRTEEIELYGKLGYRIKLLAAAERRGAAYGLRVVPTLVPYSHPLAGVKNEFNAVFVTGDVVGDLLFTGKGAGALPTGSAIVEDILNAVRGNTFTPDRETYAAQEDSGNAEEWTEAAEARAALFTLSKQAGDPAKFRLLSFLSSEAGFLHSVDTLESEQSVHVAAILSGADTHVLQAFADHLNADLRLRAVLDDSLAAASREADVTFHL